jgi:hypothetical protein
MQLHNPFGDREDNPACSHLGAPGSQCDLRPLGHHGLLCMARPHVARQRTNARGRAAMTTAMGAPIVFASNMPAGLRQIAARTRLVVDTSHNLDLLVLQRTTLGSRCTVSCVTRHRRGKVAKVVYACRGPKMMDSMSRWLGHSLSRCGFLDRQQIPAGNPVSPDPQV